MADANGNFDWSVPDAEVHAFVNHLERDAGTYLYGRRLYDVMAAWETMTLEDEPDFARDYARIWRAADKVVYSTTLDAPRTAKTRIERAFEPAAIGRMKAAAQRDLTVGGPTLAAQALKAGLVDEIRLFLSPVAVGAGTPALPAGVRLALELLEERRFGNGVVYLRYRVVL